MPSSPNAERVEHWQSRNQRRRETLMQIGADGSADAFLVTAESVKLLWSCCLNSLSAQLTRIFPTRNLSCCCATWSQRLQSLNKIALVWRETITGTKLITLYVFLDQKWLSEIVLTTTRKLKHMSAKDLICQDTNENGQSRHEVFDDITTRSSAQFSFYTKNSARTR
jgi:hypothetical protein